MSYLSKNIEVGYKCINKMSTWAKILIITVLVLIIFKHINNRCSKYEGFGNKEEFKLTQGNEIYDDFYANTYDALTYAHTKNQFEMEVVKKETKPTSQSIVLDIGSGTGHHIKQFKELGITNATGVDTSKSMVRKAKELYPDNNYVQGDALNPTLFKDKSFTHITCFYFTLYYFKDKSVFFNNCYNWLMPGGHLIVHMVDNEMFDPILPTANPLLIVSPQKYAKKRITHSNIVFDEFKYNAEFNINDNENATFVEKFSTRDSNRLFRKNKHEMFMESNEKIIGSAQKSGFIVEKKMDMVKAEYEFQYLYVFQKPE
jgi:ubiquinone/menaquinone biosynthesis C-methylase UbiE